MKSYEYQGYTTREGGIVCTDCTGKLTEAEETELGYSPIFADSEWDYYPACDICGRVLDYVCLTTEGKEQEKSKTGE